MYPSQKKKKKGFFFLIIFTGTYTQLLANYIQYKYKRELKFTTGRSFLWTLIPLENYLIFFFFFFPFLPPLYKKKKCVKYGDSLHKHHSNNNPSGVTQWVKYSKCTAHLARQYHRLYSEKRVQQSLGFFLSLLGGKSVFTWRSSRLSPYTGVCLYIHTLSDRAGCEPQTQASCAQ